MSRDLEIRFKERNYQEFQKKILYSFGISENIDFVFSHIGISSMRNYLDENRKNICKCIPVTLTSRGEKFIKGYSKTDRSIPDIVY